jgi:hypothetical protein
MNVVSPDTPSLQANISNQASVKPASVQAASQEWQEYLQDHQQEHAFGVQVAPVLASSPIVRANVQSVRVEFDEPVKPHAIDQNSYEWARVWQPANEKSGN